MPEDDQQYGYTKVRDGVLDHHPKMSFAEIAVFHHLLNRANRTSRRGALGLCPGLSGNRIAEDMGKSRDSIHRALRELETGGYITRTVGGILVHKFAHPAGKQATGPESGRPGNRPGPAGKQAGAGRETGRSRPESRPPNRSTGDVRIDEETMARGEPAPPLPEIGDPPVAYWDSALQRVLIDEGWLRRELAELESESHVQLMRQEYETELEALRLAVIADPRLRACIRKADGKPSSPSQFKRFASYTSGWFKRALRSKARGKSGASRNDQRKAKTDEAFRSAMKDALEEEQRGNKAGSDRDSGALALFLPASTRDPK